MMTALEVEDVRTWQKEEPGGEREKCICVEGKGVTTEHKKVASLPGVQ